MTVERAGASGAMRHEGFRLFEVFGVEVEYMIVDRDSLAVRPICDLLLRDASTLKGARVVDEGEESDPEFPSEVELEGVALSNELAAHVLEIKVPAPVRSLVGVDQVLHRGVRAANALLAQRNCMLLPTGVHATMDPGRDLKLWPHGYRRFYETFHRIFDCRGHGWANLQAVHLNLPFRIDGDTEESEFGRLHTAVRALLPIMPAIAASSPFLEGRATGLLDNRMEVYRTGARAIPSTIGSVIPEPVFTRSCYERDVLGAMYEQLAPHDPDGVLHHEWINARGAIARFSRSSIEVRVLDVQECPRMDVAVCALVSTVLRMMTRGGLGDLAAMRALPTAGLATILQSTIRDASAAPIHDQAFLHALGLRRRAATAGELWSFLALSPEPDEAAVYYHDAIMLLLRRGPLARRMLDAIGSDTSLPAIAFQQRELARCLASDMSYAP